MMLRRKYGMTTYLSFSNQHAFCIRAASFTTFAQYFVATFNNIESALQNKEKELCNSDYMPSQFRA